MLATRYDTKEFLLNPSNANYNFTNAIRKKGSRSSLQLHACIFLPPPMPSPDTDQKLHLPVWKKPLRKFKIISIPQENKDSVSYTAM